MGFEWYLTVLLFLVREEDGLALLFFQRNALEVNGDSCRRCERSSSDRVHYVWLITCEDVGFARQDLGTRGCRVFVAQALALAEQGHG